MPRIPKISRPKELPSIELQPTARPADIKLEKEQPLAQPMVEDTPIESDLVKEKPVESQQLEEMPVESAQLEEIPEESPEKTDMPSDLNLENCVEIDGQQIEIKPTKLKYFRNKAASAYGIIKAVPIHELLTYGKGVIDEKRDADQLLYDFLVSAFDDKEFVRSHYDEMDADQVEKIIEIFGRINHINEKEEAARKNREAQAQQKR